MQTNRQRQPSSRLPSCVPFFKFPITQPLPGPPSNSQAAHGTPPLTDAVSSFWVVVFVFDADHFAIADWARRFPVSPLDRRMERCRGRGRWHHCTFPLPHHTTHRSSGNPDSEMKSHGHIPGSPMSPTSMKHFAHSLRPSNTRYTLTRLVLLIVFPDLVAVVVVVAVLILYVSRRSCGCGF